MGEGVYKASKGLIRVKIQVRSEMIKDITISGDFFMHPEDRLWELESFLTGTPAEEGRILSKIEDFYAKTRVLTPGVTPRDFKKAIMKGIEDEESRSE